MTDNFSVEAELREVQGKGASRRLRRLEAKVPAILYGGKEESINLSLIAKDFAKLLENEAFYSHILTIKFDGKEQAAILKDLQRHPAKGFVLHADFQRVSKDSAIHVNVPLHFINEASCQGVKIGGGNIIKQLNEVEVICLPGDLPEYIEVDMQDVDVEQVVHLSELKLPEGVRIAAFTHGDIQDHDTAVVAVQKPKGTAESADTETSEDEGESEES